MNPELLINDQIVAIERLHFHAQDEAFPGGHQFNLELNDAGLADVLRKRFGAGVSSPSRSDTSFIFGMINSVITFRRLKNPEQRLAYLANTITVFRVNNDTVVCSGICSKIPDKPSGA